MPPTSALLVPPPELSGCVFAAIVRDTRGATLSDAERLNHFPASPLISVTFVIEGALYFVPMGRELAGELPDDRVPELSATPPMDQPVSSWSPGPVAVVTIGIFPEAWMKLQRSGGDEFVVQALKDAFVATPRGDDFATRWAGFCTAIAPGWQEARTTGGLSDWAGSMRLADWTRSILGRAALAGPGRSIRALERRLRRWSQQSRQSLKFFADIENLHKLSTQAEGASLAELATDAGYADQSHMGRAVRRATGFSPAELNRRVETEEAFWCYRLLGERF